MSAEERSLRWGHKVKLVVCVWIVILSFWNAYRVHHIAYPTFPSTKRLPPQAPFNTTTVTPDARPRVLYVVTSLAEFDNGKRATERGYDRFSHTLVPVVRESTRTMVQSGFKVDFYLITHYKLSNDRRKQLNQVLPDGVGMQVWDDATPLGYDEDHNMKEIVPISRSLSRQHRYVIKDKYFYYDLFVSFEDDMVVKGAHVAHYVDMTQTLYRMRSGAPKKLPTAEVPNPEAALKLFFGKMTTTQLQRMIPGFIRVEAGLPGYKPHKRNLYPQIPINLHWNTTIPRGRVDPSVCCHVSPESSNDHIPQSPSEDDLYFWETSLDALGVRQLPDGQWVLLQAGNTDAFYLDETFVIGDFWSGRDSGYFAERPDPTHGRYLNNQGGWMATRRQISDYHRRWCRGGFLPPYDLPTHKGDGLVARSVEYWSGGIQIAGIMACNMQRVIALDPDGFSRHLLYHASNNKQRQKNIQYRFSSHTVQEFWGQLNKVRKNAEAAKTSALSKQSRPRS